MTTTPNDITPRALATVIEVHHLLAEMKLAAARDDGATVLELARRIAAKIETDDDEANDE